MSKRDWVEFKGKENPRGGAVMIAKTASGGFHLLFLADMTSKDRSSRRVKARSYTKKTKDGKVQTVLQVSKEAAEILWYLLGQEIG